MSSKRRASSMPNQPVAPVFPFPSATAASDLARMPPPSTPVKLRAPQLPSGVPTPIAKTENSSRATVLENDAGSRYRRLALEIQTTLIGPMPVEQFLKFLPLPHNGRTMPSPQNAFDDVPTKGPERYMNKPITEAFNATSQGPQAVRRCPGIMFYDTGNNRERIHQTNDDRFNSKFDITGYWEEIETEDGVETKQSMPGRAQTLVELKLRDFAKDPDSGSLQEFVLFDHIGDQKDRDNAIKALGQQVSYATEVCARQHRNFLFTLFMTPDTARLLRWDRAGVVISASFNYRTSPELLCEFLWRFGSATDAERGADITIVVASDAEKHLLRSAIEKHVRSQLGDDFATIKAEIDHHYDANSVMKIPVRNTTINKAPRGDIGGESTVTEDASELVKELEFLVSRPVAISTSMASRATRGYWALNPKTGKIVFLKDVWRTNVDGMEKEGDILKSVIDHKVPNVPTLVCYGDVGDTGDIDTTSPAHITQTDRYKNANWNTHRPLVSRLTSRVHYRQVIEEAGYTLEHMAGSRELFRGAYDAFKAMRRAYKNGKRLHRDVSSTNIILFADTNNKYGDRRGILIDWELSCVVKEGDAREHWRTGTWAFMSINTLLPKPNPHQLIHDVESLIYVVFYCAIFFLSWEYDDFIHEKLITDFFDQTNREKEGAPPTGGAGKRANLFDPIDPGSFFNLPKGMSAWLSTWLQEILKPLGRFYTKPPKLSFKAQDKAIGRIFFHDDDFGATLLNNDRTLHPRPGYTGPTMTNFPATRSSSRHPSSSRPQSSSKQPSISLVNDHKDRSLSVPVPDAGPSYRISSENINKRKSTSAHDETESKRQNTGEGIPPRRSLSRSSKTQLRDQSLPNETTESLRKTSSAKRSSSHPKRRKSP